MATHSTRDAVLAEPSPALRSARRLRASVLMVVLLGLVSAFTFGSSVSPASADYAAAVLADHPVSYWRLNDSSGSTAIDQAGLNPGQITGAALGEPGPFAGSGSMRFEGNGSVDLGHDASLRPPGSWTLEAWFRASASDAAKCANNFGGDACYLYRYHAFGFGLALQKDGTVSAGVSADNATSYDVASPPISYADERWHYAAVVRAPSSLSLFIDSQEVASTPTMLSTTSACCENVAAIANDGACHCSGLTGWESEVAFYNYPLSATRIAAHYAAAPPVPPKPDQPLTGSPLLPGGALFNSRTGVALLQEAWDFTDSDPGAMPSDFSASIDWGDGNTSASQVSQSCLGQSCFFVAGGTHAYLSTGTFTATAHIQDNVGRADSGGSTVAIPTTIVVTQLLSLQTKHDLAHFADLLDSNVSGDGVAGLAISVVGVFVGGIPGGLAATALDAVLFADASNKAEQATALRALANDPPDTNFRALVSPVLGKQIKVARPVPTKLRRLLQALLDNGRQESAYFKALLVSLERAQGASAAGVGDWTLRQMTAAADFASKTAHALRHEATLLMRLRTALAHAPRWNPSLSKRQVRRVQRQVKSRGLPRAVKRVLRADGATRADLSSLRAAIIATPARKLTGRVFSHLASRSRIAGLARLARELSDYAAQIASAGARQGSH